MKTTRNANLGRGFLPLWLSATISNLGDGMRTVALPLLAYRLTQDPLDIALVTILSALPWIIGGPLVGVLVDRMDRRWATFAGNASRAVLVGALALLVVSDTVRMWHIYLLAVLMPLFEAMVDGAALPLIQRIVPTEKLEKANSRLFTARILSEDIVGSPVAGILFATAAAVPFFVDSATFLAAALLVLLIPAAEGTGAVDGGNDEEATSGSSVFGELREGLRQIWTTPLLRHITLVSGVVNFSLMAGTGLLVVFVKEDIGLSDAQFGLLFTVAALGSALGGTLAPRIVDRLGTAGALVFSVTLQGAARVLFGFSQGVLTAYVAFFCAGVGSFVWHVAANSYRQRVTPNALLGRVYTASFAFFYLMTVVGALPAGIVAQHLGARPVMVTGGVLVLLCGAWFLRFTLRTPTALKPGSAVPPEAAPVPTPNVPAPPKGES